MTKIAIQSNASGTGTFTITAPDSNTNRTFTLPDEAGTILTSVSDIEAQVKTATNASGSAPIYACRAWVNFDGTAGSVSVRASGNVSSVTENTTGQYTINFTTAMPDANYSIVAASSVTSGTGSSTSFATINTNGSFSTTAVSIMNKDADEGLTRSTGIVCVSVFR